MEDATRMSYDNCGSVRLYQEWYPFGLHHALVDYANCQYFGDIKGKSVVEFGCGDGSFLRKCLANGASSCLGLDINESMVNGGRSPENEVIIEVLNGSVGHIQFEVQDCFEPFDDVYDQYDLAIVQFLLHECPNEPALQNFIENAFRLLKPGGKLFIGQCPYVAATTKDQEVIADLFGYLQPTREESAGKDPYFARVPAFYPGVSDTGRPFTRKGMFIFTDNYWSKETLTKNLEKLFINVEVLPQQYPMEVSPSEIKQLESMKEPVVLIGAQKPA